MPFTPFHFGPGLFLKSVLRTNFSFVIFVISQVLIDLEPGWNILRGRYPVHGFLHTYTGSLLIVVICLFVSRPIFKMLNRINLGRFSQSAGVYKLDGKVTFRITLVSSVIGVWSHVFLDSVMHRDVLPLFPFSESNTLLGACSLLFLHVGCIVLGGLGAATWVINECLVNRFNRRL